MSTIGWIGTGAMGAPMATRLASLGHQVTAFDVDKARLASLADQGVAGSDSISALAGQSEFLALMVATPTQVENVLFGDDPAAGSLSAGSTVMLMATVGPAAARRWSEQLATRDVTLVDTPVSGGTTRAANGELVAMVATPGLERVRPILEQLASTITVVGPEVGDGQKMKLVNQLLAGVHIAVAGEALAFAEAIGLDPRAAYEVVTRGAATSFMLEDRGDRMTRSAFDDVRSALDIFVKDMGLVTEAARAYDYPTPLASAAQLLYLSGRRAGLGRKDDSAVIEMLRAKR